MIDAELSVSPINFSAAHVGRLRFVLSGDADRTVAVTVFCGSDENEIARRLAACWNVCRHIPTDVLEQSGLAAATLEIVKQRDDAIARAKAISTTQLDLKHYRGQAKTLTEGSFTIPANTILTLCDEVERLTTSK